MNITPGMKMSQALKAGLAVQKWNLGLYCPNCVSVCRLVRRAAVCFRCRRQSGK